MPPIVVMEPCVGSEPRRRLPLHLPAIRADIASDISAYTREYMKFVNVVRKRDKGRPPIYHPSLCRVVHDLALLNLQDDEIAKFIGVDVSTFNRWKDEHLCFRESLVEGREGVDSRVVGKLKDRALGYTYRRERVISTVDGAEKISHLEHIPPDIGAIKLWLNNRRPDHWRDTPKPDEDDPGRHPEFTAVGLREAIEAKMAKLKSRLTLTRTTVTEQAVVEEKS